MEKRKYLCIHMINSIFVLCNQPTNIISAIRSVSFYEKKKKKKIFFRQLNNLYKYLSFFRNIKNPIIPNAWPHGYVLKVVNSLDTKKVKFFDGQTQLLLFLRQQGIECPKPVMNIFGKYHSIEKIGEGNHLIRLLEFVPGKVFNQVLKTNHLYYQVGEFTAKIDLALKRFTHDAYQSHRSLWMLESLPQLSKFLYAVGDTKRQTLVQEVMNEFNEHVLSHIDEFGKGVIHGDFNESNIVVTKPTPDSDEFRVTGVIDFGDTCYSLYVFELAITIAYMLLQSSELATAGYVIAGYQEIRIIPENERKVLKVSEPFMC